MFTVHKILSSRFVINLLVIALICCSNQLFATKRTIGMLTYILGQVEISNSQDREADFGIDIYEGDIITSANNSAFTITYYNGCRQEAVRENSSVKVGANNSSIINGSFSKIDSFDCEIPQPRLSDNDSHKKAGITFRGNKNLLTENKINYEDKMSTSCIHANSNQAIKQLRKKASNSAFQKALTQFLNKTDASAASINNTIIMQELLNNYVQQSKIVKYYTQPNQICADVLVTANSKELTEGLQIVNNSKKIKLLSDNRDISNDLNFKLWTNRKDSPFFRDDDGIFIYFISNKEVYLKLDYFMSDGTVAHLIPNIISSYQKIKAGKLYTLGGKNSELSLVATSPYGTEEIRALISDEPFGAIVKTKEAVENSSNYEALIAKYLSKNKSTNKLVSASFELISTP